MYLNYVYIFIDIIIYMYILYMIWYDVIWYDMILSDCQHFAQHFGGWTPGTALVREVSLVALRQWLRVPGSDVEKALRRAMRARHAELNQATRAAIAQRVLGIAVFYGRLGHLLDRAFRRKGNIDPEIEAEMLLELYVGRELREEGGLTLSNGLQGGHGGHGRLDDEVECKLREAVRAPLFEADEEPLLAVRLATAWSLPLWMAESWLQQFGPLSAFQLGRAMCQPARVTLRVNTFKTTRLKLMELLANHGVRSVPTAESPVGLWLPDGRPPAGGVWQLPGYSDGLFEVQDEGSQLLALATEAKPGDLVVDYCAGRGGKTWFLASLVSPNGSVCAWDIEEDLRKQLQGARAKRALGETNLHLLQVPPSKPQNLHADVVLVDAPCSSSGVLRRHPSQRWALRLQEVSEIADLQLSILEEASQLLRPGGRLVYATCSLIHLENQRVVAGFEALQRGFVRWPFPSGRSEAQGTQGNPKRNAPNWNQQDSTGWKPLVPYVTLVKIPESQRKKTWQEWWLPKPNSSTADSVHWGCFHLRYIFSAFTRINRIRSGCHAPVWAYAAYLSHSQALPHAAAARGRYGRLLHGPLGEKKLREDLNFAPCQWMSRLVGSYRFL